jgi:hypothetical protein
MYLLSATTEVSGSDSDKCYEEFAHLRFNDRRLSAGIRKNSHHLKGCAAHQVKYTEYAEYSSQFGWIEVVKNINVGYKSR